MPTGGIAIDDVAAYLAAGATRSGSGRHSSAGALRARSRSSTRCVTAPSGGRGGGLGAKVTNGHEPYDVIALGETMLSLVAADGTLATAKEFVATHGGAESNTLVALARSGARTAWISRLGDDPAGERMRVRP